MAAEHSFVVFVFLQLGLILPSAAQEPPAPVIAGGIPRHIVFYQFFQRISPPDGEPKQQEEAASAWLRQVARSAQLRDDQVEIIRSLAADCLAKVSGVDEKAKAITAFGHDRRLNPTGPPPELLPDLKRLEEERTRTIQESILRLREALGEKAFSGLESALTPAAGSGMSVRLPDELSRPASPDRRVQRGDFQVPERESMYESKLPVKVMITPVSEDGITEKTRFTMDEPVRFKITLLNTADRILTMDVEAVMRRFSFLGTKLGEDPKRAVIRFEFLPGRGMLGTLQLPFNVPVVVGTARLTPGGTIFPPGQYSCTLQRPLGLPSPLSDADNQLNVETALLSLNSNTIVFEVVQ
jgi:hypothetical protein